MSLLMEALKKAELAKKKALTDQNAANQDPVSSLAGEENSTDLHDETLSVDIEHNLLDVPSELGINEDELELELEKMLDGNNDTSHSEILLDDDKVVTSEKVKADELQLIDDVSPNNDNAAENEVPARNIEEDRFENALFSDDADESSSKVAIESNTIDYPYPDQAETLQDLTATTNDDVSGTDVVEKPSPDLSETIPDSGKKQSLEMTEKLAGVRARDQLFSGSKGNNDHLDKVEITATDNIEKQNEVPEKIPEKIDNEIKVDPFSATISSASASTKFKTKFPKKNNGKRNIVSIAVLSVSLIGAAFAYIYMDNQLQSFSTGVVQLMPVNQDLETGLNTTGDEQQKDDSLLEENNVVGVESKTTLLTPHDVSDLNPQVLPRTPRVPVKVSSTSKSLVEATPQKTPIKKPVVPVSSNRSAVEKKTIAKANNNAAKSKPVSITHENVVDETYELLLDAYNDFNNEKYDAAKEKYQKVLQQSEENRDALLGLAAISARNNNINSAQDYYSRLLRKNKHDSVALAGLVEIVGKMDPLAAESELKTLVSRESGAAYLHFALGNVYVAQQRWADAQASYFIAAKIDKISADYAYNLAVSLDMLGESKPAAEYYRKALALSKEGKALFDSKIVSDRLLSLQNSSGVK